MGRGWPHDRQPDTTGSLEDSTPQELTDAEHIIQEDMPEPRHIPSWAWPERRGTKRSFEWVTRDSISQGNQDTLRPCGPEQPLGTIQEVNVSHPTVSQDFSMMWLIIWQCFLMCRSTLAKVQELNAQQDSGREYNCNLSLTVEPKPKPSERQDAYATLPRASGAASPFTSQPAGVCGDDTSFRRRLRPMPNGQLPKVQQILALATQHNLYKDSSQFKWLNMTNRTFQLRTPCQRACINFYADTGSAYVSGLDKYAGLKYVQGWTDADWKQPRRKKSKAASSSAQALAPLTPEQARALLEL